MITKQNQNITDSKVIAARAEYLKALDAYEASTPWLRKSTFDALEHADLAYFNARRDVRDSVRRA